MPDSKLKCNTNSNNKKNKTNRNSGNLISTIFHLFKKITKKKTLLQTHKYTFGAHFKKFWIFFCFLCSHIALANESPTVKKCMRNACLIFFSRVYILALVNSFVLHQKKCTNKNKNYHSPSTLRYHHFRS